MESIFIFSKLSHKFFFKIACNSVSCLFAHCSFSFSGEIDENLLSPEYFGHIIDLIFKFAFIPLMDLNFLLEIQNSLAGFLLCKTIFNLFLKPNNFLFFHFYQFIFFIHLSLLLSHQFGHIHERRLIFLNLIALLINLSCVYLKKGLPHLFFDKARIFMQLIKLNSLKIFFCLRWKPLFHWCLHRFQKFCFHPFRLIFNGKLFLQIENLKFQFLYLHIFISQCWCLTELPYHLGVFVFQFDHLICQVLEIRIINLIIFTFTIVPFWRIN